MRQVTKYTGILLAVILSSQLMNGTWIFPFVQLADAAQATSPSEVELENIVKRSYQYVALYNTILGFTLSDKNPFSTHGWNKTFKPTDLLDASVRVIAAPNNDTLYVPSALDLRAEPVVISYPAFDSDYVSLETSAFDHYCNIPLATSKGDFRTPTTVLYYSALTQGYAGEAVVGVDHIVEMTGDFSVAFLRVMPHSSEPERFKRITQQIQQVKLQTLAEFLGRPAQQTNPVHFPQFGRDIGVFTNNFTEVMQFVVNHTVFQADDHLDREFLLAMKGIGIEPGNSYDPGKVAQIDVETMKKVVARVAAWGKASIGKYKYDKFKPKGQMSLGAMVAQSVTGPVGQPSSEAIYLNIFESADHEPLNAMHDYVIHMTQEELPPAKAFWSITLFDSENAFFIPNAENKYSVGENAGMKLDKDGGITIWISAEQPANAPAENWLPIQRLDQELRLQIRLYVPDMTKAENWVPPIVGTM